MDEIELTLRLYYEGNVDPADLQTLHDRFAAFMEQEADDMLLVESAELTDYAIEIERGS